MDYPEQSYLDLPKAPPAIVSELADAIPQQVHDIVGYLFCHAEGIANAKTSRQIAEGIGLTGTSGERKVRHLISCYHAQLPVVVCARPGKGFYITKDPEQMAHYERTLYALLKAAAAHISAFRRNASRNGYRRINSRENVTYERIAAA